jgi:predicted small lipoprotein YifL
MNGMFLKNRYVQLSLLSLITMVALLAACGPSTPEAMPPEDTGAATAAVAAEDGAAVAATSTAPPVPVSEEGYPVQVAPTIAPAAYPPEAPPTIAPTPLPEGYPAATAEVFLEPRFRFDTPLAAGATNVTGQAPPNLSLAVLDVTFNGVLLGTGRSDENGRFSIPVSPLPAGNRIGLVIGELAEGQTLADMAETYFPYRGEGFMNLPNVGVLFETALVEQ